LFARLYLFRNLIGLLTLVAVIGVAIPVSLMDDNIRIASAENEVVLESADASSRVAYQVGSRQHLHVRVLHYDTQRFAFSKGAFRGFLGYLSENEYAQMQAIRGCKAGFLNEHAKLLLVVPQNEDQVRSLKRLSLSQGDRVSLDLSELRPRHVRIDGHDLPLTAWGFNPGNIVAINDIQVTDK
jgi:hypothetical protein